MNARVVAGIMLFLGLCSAPCDAATVLVTGANRGLGLEFARQYAARGFASRLPLALSTTTRVGIERRGQPIQSVEAQWQTSTSRA
jgi:NADP-dependent 3-hydroxy acid dehydrogenase YdfG